MAELPAGSPANQNRRFLSELLALEAYDNATAHALFARFVKNETWQCPTLVTFKGVVRVDDPQAANDEWFKYLPKDLLSSWRNAKGSLLFKDMTPEGWAASRSVFDHNLKLVGDMYRAGVGILAGTDVGMYYCSPGFSLHDELALLVQAGLSPMAALQTATSNPARFMGQLDRWGTIETGKTADVVLLDKDPLADIHNSRSIRAVVLNGKLIPRDELDRMLAEAETLAAK